MGWSPSRHPSSGGRLVLLAGIHVALEDDIYVHLRFRDRRPIITVVTMIALVVFGLASLARLDTDEFPDIDQPIVFIGIAYPGAAPDVVEREVVGRIEDKMSGISGVEKINSTSTDGFAQIIIQFVFSQDVNQATQDVRDAISAVRAQLPGGNPRADHPALRPELAADRLARAHVDACSRRRS